MGDIKNKKDPKTEKENQEKIESLRGIIEEAEKSLYSARAMLMRLGGGAPNTSKKTYGASPNGKIVEGIFDGQIMIGNDGKQYPVPANYASKSKLVEGDMLKLTITDDGSFIYKQIGPVERKRLIGIVREDESGSFIVEADNHSYKILLASATYYKAQPGDEVTVVIPKSGDPTWGSIENVTKKAFEISESESAVFEDQEQDPFLKREEEISSSNQKEKLPEEEEIPTKETKDVGTQKQKTEKGIIDEWTPKLSQIEKEAGEIEKNVKDQDRESQRDYKQDLKDEGEEKVAIKVNDDSGRGVVKKDFPDTAEEFFSAKL